MQTGVCTQQTLTSQGRALDEETRAYFESRLRFDLSKVRVHTDARAAESARAVNALAYTVGHNIVFGQGRYAPGEREGRRLLAHELAHVAQQGFEGGAAPGSPAARRGPAGVLRRAPAVYETRLREVVAGSIGKAEHTAAAVLEIRGWTSDPLDTVATDPDLAAAVGGAYEKLQAVLKKAGFNTMPAGTMRLVATSALDEVTLAKVLTIATERKWKVVVYRAASATSIVEEKTVDPSAAPAPAAADQPAAPQPTGSHAPDGSVAVDQSAPPTIAADGSYGPPAPNAALPGPVAPAGQQGAAGGPQEDELRRPAPMSTVTSGDKQALLTVIRSVRKVEDASGAYAATWEGKTTYIKPEQYEAFLARIGVEIRNAAVDVERIATDAESYYRGQTEVNRRYWFSSELVRVFGSVQDPGPQLINMVNVARAATAMARKALTAGDYEGAAASLADGEVSARTALAMWKTYFNSVLNAGELTISALETTRKVAAVALLALAVVASGGAALGVAGLAAADAAAAGYVMTAAALAEQGSIAAAKWNDGDEVDWIGVGLNMLLTVVLQYLGGRASQKILDALILKGAPIAEKVFAGMLTQFLVGRGSAAIQGIINKLWAKHKAAKKGTWGEFLAEVLTEVTDPEGAFLDLLFGAFGGISHVPAGQKPVPPAGQAPSKVVTPAEPPPAKAASDPPVQQAKPIVPAQENKPAAPAQENKPVVPESNPAAKVDGVPKVVDAAAEIRSEVQKIAEHPEQVTGARPERHAKVKAADGDHEWVEQREGGWCRFSTVQCFDANGNPIPKAADANGPTGNEEQAKSNEEQAKSNEEQAKSNEEQAKSNEEQAKSNEEQAKSNEEQAKSNEEQAKEENPAGAKENEANQSGSGARSAEEERFEALKSQLTDAEQAALERVKNNAARLVELTRDQVRKLIDVAPAGLNRLLNAFDNTRLAALLAHGTGAEIDAVLQQHGQTVLRALLDNPKAVKSLQKIGNYGRALIQARAVEGVVDRAAGSATLILDNNAQTVTRMLLEKTAWSELQDGQRAVINRIRQETELLKLGPRDTIPESDLTLKGILGTEDVIVPGTPLAEGAPLPGVRRSGLAVSVSHDDPAWGELFKMLEAVPAIPSNKSVPSATAPPTVVGENKGTMDRAMLADVFFASTTGGATPRFVTGDTAIFERLFAFNVSPVPPGTQPIRNGERLSAYIARAFPGGYTAEIQLPLAGRTVRAHILPPVR